MSANLRLAAAHPGFVVLAVVILVMTKVIVAFGVGYVKRRNLRTALRFSLALPEGSEFSFVLFATAVASGALDREQADLAAVVVALSMMLAPVLFAGSELVVMPRLEGRRELPADEIEAPDGKIIICGFGRVGQIIGRILRMQQIAFTALDKSSAQVEVVRRFGGKVYFGNPAREEVMRAAGGESASVLVVALDDMDETLNVVDMARRHFPHLVILARARNRHHAHLLMDRDVTRIVRETFFSSLHLAGMVLGEVGVPAEASERAIALFREHDERTLIETHAIAHDESQLIQSTQQAAQELQELFEADTEGRAAAAAG